MSRRDGIFSTYSDDPSILCRTVLTFYKYFAVLLLKNNTNIGLSLQLEQSLGWRAFATRAIIAL